MFLSVTNRRFIAIWLSAILLVLSVAAAAHSVEHIDDGVKKHCTLCFHQHQFDQVLPQQNATLDLNIQQVETTATVEPKLTLIQRVNYHSRAPPETL